MRPTSLRRQRGFTLVELVVTMVIIGIVAGMVTVFISAPVRSYLDTAARVELADAADTATRRIARDVRLALPNSVRVDPSRKYLELLLTKTGGRYLAQGDATPGNILGFDPDAPPANPNVFTIVGAAPSGVQAIRAGDFIVVNNLGDSAPVNAYECTAKCNRATVASVAGNSVTMVANPFLAANPSNATMRAMPSQSNRFQVVTTPVTYYCAPGGTLQRYSGYAIQAAQPVNAAAAPLLNAPVSGQLAGQVAECGFSLGQLANVQRGLITINLTLGVKNSSAGQVTLMQQAQVNNTP
ncbi:type II secretion system protein [Janthinobacterium aquaticum]|uniref:type II secretion system protein n=1 Tax=Janthinobacterium sp. FT58W TaxID=2654254 RepID=UPI0012658734|nr:type II secretion system protein [Janthinobacterium sp. FT58W]KAB8044999.1 prepilin-type N-terminal cleavage/methylation domain-containing protein [Janthinobacterium sp. FT58W]